MSTSKKIDTWHIEGDKPFDADIYLVKPQSNSEQARGTLKVFAAYGPEKPGPRPPRAVTESFENVNDLREVLEYMASPNGLGLTWEPILIVSVLTNECSDARGDGCTMAEVGIKYVQAWRAVKGSKVFYSKENPEDDRRRKPLRHWELHTKAADIVPYGMDRSDNLVVYPNRVGDHNLHRVDEVMKKLIELGQSLQQINEAKNLCSLTSMNTSFGRLT